MEAEVKGIVVCKLDKPYHDGDWHDPMLKWSVIGPDNEVQNFSTKKNAELYKKCRKNAKTQREASTMYVNA
jgi:hypothetical protein